jgi:hypothetical protein
MTWVYPEPNLVTIGQRAVAQSGPGEAMWRLVVCDIPKPIGVSDYELTRALPESLKSSLPSIEEIEAALQSEFGDQHDEP